MKRSLLISTLALASILAACSFPSAAPATIVPSTDQSPTATLPPVTTQPPVAQGQPMLTGTTWMWIGFTGPNNQVAVESPMDYSLVFQEDGNVDIKADCNNAQGSYQTDGQSLSIQVGLMTKAMCPPGSRSDEFIQYLGNAAAYSFEEGNLYVDLVADGGTMVFAPSDGSVAGSASSELDNALLANPWQWVSFINPVERYDVQPPENYRLTFHQDGSVEIKTDCNNASGTYSMEGNRISIVIGPMTMAACPPGSRSEEFIKYLGSAAIYFFQPGELFIDLFADGGTMRFRPSNQGN